VPSDDKKKARLNCISHLLGSIPYEDIIPPPVELPAMADIAYIRPPMEDQTFIPQVY